jgi:hypothetical protein
MSQLKLKTGEPQTLPYPGKSCLWQSQATDPTYGVGIVTSTSFGLDQANTNNYTNVSDTTIGSSTRRAKRADSFGAQGILLEITKNSFVFVSGNSVGTSDDAAKGYSLALGVAQTIEPTLPRG